MVYLRISLRRPTMGIIVASGVEVKAAGGTGPLGPKAGFQPVQHSLKSCATKLKKLCHQA